MLKSLLHTKDYKFLPDFLKSSSNIFKNQLEKDAFLISSVVLISGCLPNVYGKYYGKKVGVNLYLFIIAPASAGKGVISWSKRLADEIHNQKREEYQRLQEEFEVKEIEFSSLSRREKVGAERPVSPKSTRLFIPANTSSAMFLRSLEDNEGKAILFETEADTLSNNLKNEWGNYDSILRAAFHHEPVGQLRRDEDIEISNPFLSVILSGTPEQVKNLIPSPENGLFSRFCFFQMPLDIEWKDVFMLNEEIDFTIIDEKAQELLKVYNTLKSRQTNLFVDLTRKQKEQLNLCFDGWQKQLYSFVGSDIIPSIRRLGLITYRIALILTCLRNVDRMKSSEELYCNDFDFATSLDIVEYLKNQAVEVYCDLPKSGLVGKKQKLYDSLPDEFTREIALKKGLVFGCNQIAVDRFIASNHFIRIDRGKYKKAN